MKKTILLLTIFSFRSAAFSQQGNVLTVQDYTHAESFMNYNTGPLVDHPFSRPNWISGDRFWYRDLNAKGSEFILVDPANGKLTAAFDQAKLAYSLSAASALKDLYGEECESFCDSERFVFLTSDDQIHIRPFLRKSG